jgi:hypothetical protein
MELVVGGKGFKRRGESFLASKQTRLGLRNDVQKLCWVLIFRVLQGNISAVGILQ